MPINYEDYFPAPAGGGLTLPYWTGRVYPAVVGPGGSTVTADNDYIVPFTPRADVTVDKVAWYRTSGAAASVYVGIYSIDGTLLTDCANDFTNNIGWHGVETTNVDLLQGSLYWLALNASAGVAATAGASTGVYGSPGQAYTSVYGFAVNVGSATNTAGAAQLKPRTAGTLLSSLTMSGWGSSPNAALMGIIPV